MSNTATGILTWWEQGALMFIPSTEKHPNALVTFDGGTENIMQQKGQSFVLSEVPSY